MASGQDRQGLKERLQPSLPARKLEATAATTSRSSFPAEKKLDLVLSGADRRSVGQVISPFGPQAASYRFSLFGVELLRR